MSQRASPTLIGGFVLGALALFVVGLMVFGGGRYFKETLTVVAYFSGSVSGLGVGAPVEFRGVKIGEVSKIQAVFNPQALDIRIPVYMEFQPDRITQVGGETRPGQNLPFLIERGMRAQLQVQSLVTGQLMVALDFHPDSPARYQKAAPLVQEIPTIPSNLEQLQRRLQQLPLDEIADNLLAAVTGLNELLNMPELREAIASFDEALKDVGRLARNVDGQVGPVSEGLQQTLSIAAEDSPLRYELNQTLAEISEAARSLRVLADYLERHPEALLAGKGTGGSR